MKITSAVERLELSAGSSHTVPLEFHNGSEVIESATVRVVGLDPELVSCEPASVALFPDAVGHIAVTVRLPAAFPAGVHTVTLFVQGVSPDLMPARHDLELVVAEQPALELSVEPRIVRARRRGTFAVTVANRGNTSVDVALRAVDADRLVSTQVAPSTLTVPIAGSATCMVVVRGPRHLVGGDLDREVTITAEASGAEDSLRLVLRQRPTFTRGLITALVLAGIVLLWALAFLFGIRQALGIDPYAKVAPASFFAGQSAPGTDAASGASPEGAMPKSGTVPGGVGATLTGTVRGKLDGQGLGRIRVDVLRQGREGLVQVASTASLTDGGYSVPGLLPGEYYVRARAKGYDPVWFPAASGRGGADRVKARAQDSSEGVDLVMTGDPATLTGRVTVPGDPTSTPVTVTAAPTWAGADETDTRTVQAAPDGTYVFADLPAPATYELTFSATGLRPATSRERVLGGQDRFALDMTLGASAGSIAGLVTDGSAGLGGATVSTTVDGKPISVGTPTIGMVGAFTLGSLPTPGTYVLTVSKEGFTTRTVVVDLQAGENRANLTVPLTGGAGTVTGVVQGGGGAKLGGVRITVEGMSTPLTTNSLTGGQIGAFTLTGLTAPGQHTLTFELEGYQTVSLPVTLTQSRPSQSITVTMPSARGRLTGQVLVGGVGTNGMTVQVTDGSAVRSTTTARGPAGDGTYTFAGLPSGRYTVTVRRGDEVAASAVVTVTAGKTTKQSLPVAGGS